MDSELPWLVLLPQSILNSAPCSLFGVADEAVRIVCVEAITGKAGLARVGCLNVSPDLQSFTLTGAYSIGQIAVFDLDQYRSICRLHCGDCLRQTMGSRLFAVRKSSLAFEFAEAECHSCQRKAARSARSSSSPCRSFLAHSYLFRVLHRRWQEGRAGLANLSLDLLLGLCLTLFFWHLMTPSLLNQVVELFVVGASAAVKMLHHLIVWLMGAPAGLKINRPLSWFLGQFYLYHVTVWHNYVSSFVVPYLPSFLSNFHYIGICGLSVFLALLMDVINVFLVHLSCFYIYAAKLYRCQTRLLYSLGCLFRGKKWNPLRQRVDTAPFLTDRVFVGVLIFSMTVFLLPTTALFYSVFTFVRIVILALQCLLCRPVSILMSVPVAELLLWFTNSDKVRDRMEVEIFQRRENQIFFKVTFRKKTLWRFYEENSHKVGDLFGESYNISSAIGRIFRGDILYP